MTEALQSFPQANARAARQPISTNGDRVNLRFIDWIWNVRGSVALEPGMSVDDVFGRLDPLFLEYGTTQERSGNWLAFSKKDQSAQDKMSVFDHGVLKIEQGVGAAILHYRLASRTLLFCFLAPLLFLGFAQISIALSNLDSPKTEAAEKAKKDPVLTQHPIDKFLGAPAPEKPKKDAADKSAEKKSSPTSAYVFAALFAALYVIGRILEDRLVKRLLRRTIRGMQ